MTIPLSRPYFSEGSRKNIQAGIDEILVSGNLMPGAFNDKLESGFAELCGVPHAVSVNTCSTALTISLMYFEIEGCDVLVASGSFLTAVGSIITCGGRPVLVDMDPATLTFGAGELEAKLTSDTKGIIWTHVAGYITPQYDEIVQFAKRHGLFLIEDAAHAPGATADGRKAGSFGDAAVFSFYPSKNVTSGTGGMITTDDAALARFARETRRFGMDLESGEIKRIASDWFLDEIRACVGYYSLQELDTQLKHRRGIAERYMRALRNQPRITLIEVPEGNSPAFYQFPVFLDPDIEREDIVKAMKAEHGISTKRIWQPTHKEIPFREFDDGDLKQTEATFGRSLCLPIFVGLGDEQVDMIADALVAEVRKRL